MHRWLGIAEKTPASLWRPATAPARQAFADDGVICSGGFVSTPERRLPYPAK
jgi:hypothetical protein